LPVGITNNKLYVLDALLIHVLHGVGAPAPYPNYLNNGAILRRNIESEIHNSCLSCHSWRLLAKHLFTSAPLELVISDERA
jgi:hypothetical protein